MKKHLLNCNKQTYQLSQQLLYDENNTDQLHEVMIRVDYIIVRQRVRGSTRFRNPRPVAMVYECSEDTILAGQGFLNRVAERFSS